MTQCLNTLIENEFLAETPAEASGGGGVEATLRATRLGMAVFASSMSPDDSLVIYADLNKARKSFVLENELHMIYQVTKGELYLLRCPMV